MKNKILVFGLACLMFVMLAGCSSSGTGTIPVVTLDGVEMTVGESDIYTFLEAKKDFTADVSGGILSPVNSLDGNSWLSESIYLKKEHTRYAVVNVYNPNKDSESVYNCPISELTITPESGNALVNGIDFFVMDSPTVKQTMEKVKLARETDTGTLRYEDGDYKYFFTFDEETGIVSEITVEIVFPKSYQEKLW